MPDETRLTKAEATDLARRITLDDLYVRAGPKRRAEGGWYVVVTLADGQRLNAASWAAWKRRSGRGRGCDG